MLLSGIHKYVKDSRLKRARMTLSLIMKKTNAIRILEANKISFQLFHYEFSLEEIDAVSVAPSESITSSVIFLSPFEL